LQNLVDIGPASLDLRHKERGIRIMKSQFSGCGALSLMGGLVLEYSN